jgi:hypothetical protein
VETLPAFWPRREDALAAARWSGPAQGALAATGGRPGGGRRSAWRRRGLRGSAVGGGALAATEDGLAAAGDGLVAARFVPGGGVTWAAVPGCFGVTIYHFFSKTCCVQEPFAVSRTCVFHCILVNS